MRSIHKTLSAREAALKVLGVYRRKKAWSDLALNSVIGSSGLSALETALATSLVYGVLQNMALCDFYAGHFSSMELKKLEPRVLDILRLSIYQIVFLTKIPHSAAVNEAVSLVRKFSNQRAAGYVNAMLRRISKAALEGGLPEVEGSRLHILSVRYSHPEWLVKEMCDILGEGAAEEALIQNNSGNVPVTAQVNTLLTSTEHVLSLLESEGIEAGRHKWLDDCIELRGAGKITRLEAYKKGFIYVQDSAARLAVIAAAPKRGDFIIDGCAAPGGKSFTSALMIENEGLILACDVHGAKLRHIENGSKRLGVKIIDTIEMDASKDENHPRVAAYLEAGDGNTRVLADIVLADVPCSGFGIIRKKPEIRYKSKQDIAGLPDLQGRILSSLSKYVSAGGTLLYSTCTVLRSENEDVIESFLRKNTEFALDGFSLPEIGDVPSGMITLWPHMHGTDGFFICKLKKKRHT
ncbi:MAG: 16S rRNA (cytosine(967)-C(5))-methyltransferase RsmB [Oscillospiraceae bacterium]|nr:16S rRNA (cytosine(967)-C(5))-methyltransferase RsmB [Oscillospiraceae bacterium]